MNAIASLSRQLFDQYQSSTDSDPSQDPSSSRTQQEEYKDPEEPNTPLTVHPVTIMHSQQSRPANDDMPPSEQEEVSPVEDESAMQRSMKRDVRPLISIINQLRSMGIESDVGIPQIAACGDQSSGKSSLLEAMSGLSFPRGTGTVTRCATEFRMRFGPRFSATVFTSADPDHRDIIQREDFSAEIEKRTEELCSRDPSTRFSRFSIVIELQSPDVPDLTLIDTPGLIRNTSRNISEEDIADVDAIIDRYMRQERTIVLAIVPSNLDLATVEVLQRIRKHDPEGLRTVAVLTKPDLIDKGAEHVVMDILRNKVEPLSLGWVMVKNRSQENIDEHQPLKEARKAERAFFNNHQYFNALNFEVDALGVPVLTAKLTAVLVDRIRLTLPKITTEIKDKLAIVNEKLSELGPSIEPQDVQMELQKIWSRCSDVLSNAVNGDYVGKLFYQENSAELRLYTRITRKNEALKDAISGGIPDFQSDSYINALMVERSESKGRELPGFLNFALCRKKISIFMMGWEDEARNLNDEVSEMIMSVIKTIANLHVSRFSNFQDKILETAASVVSALRKESMQQLSTVFLAEEEPFTLNEELTKIAGTIVNKANSTTTENIASTGDQTQFANCASKSGGRMR